MAMVLFLFFSFYNVLEQPKGLLNTFLFSVAKIAVKALLHSSDAHGQNIPQGIYLRVKLQGQRDCTCSTSLAFEQSFQSGYTDTCSPPAG